MNDPRQSISAVTSGSSLRTQIADEEDAIRRGHFDGASGEATVRRRTALIDRRLQELWSRYDASGMPVLAAVGGYGRGELNPHSDIDILLLCRSEKERDRASPLLYALWDAGFDIGYSVRTVNECVDLARTDATVRTSLLESRCLAGDLDLFRSYQQKMSSDVFHRKIDAYLAEKIAERTAQRQKYGGSLYLREPNIKESAGGLRDLHMALWIAMTRFRISSFEELAEQGILSRRQLGQVLRSRSFFWRVRNEIHYLSRRKNDQLTYDLQEGAARDFHYRESAHLIPVERFMKFYFLHARVLQELSGLIVERSLRKRPSAWNGRTQQSGPFSLQGKVVFAADPGLIRHRPEAALEAFALIKSRGGTLSEQLRLDILSFREADRIRSDPAAAEVFLSLFDSPDRLSDTLMLMRDLRFLGRFLPEFRAVQALARHDHYHKYSVDEHLFAALRSLEDVWQGRIASPASLSHAFRLVTRRRVLLLAVLLHDLGKAFRRDHERYGREIAEQVLVRLGVTGDDRDRILFLVENHLIMAVLSQRRELGDRKVIADFGATVRDLENLRMLYLLTFADLSAVGPSTWTGWKAALLQDLYLRTEEHLTAAGEAVLSRTARLEAAGKRLAEEAGGRIPAGEISAFLDALPAPYLLTTSPGRMLHHLDMVRRLPQEGLVISHRHRHDRGYSELTICAYDAYGMFYRTAGTIAKQGLNILRAQVYTARNGIMIDTFQITDADGALVADESLWRSISEELRDVLTGRRRPAEPGSQPPERNYPGNVVPAVTFDNDTSETLTIVDITARDRVGLLYRVTKTLYELNIDIASAKIVTEGVRALDAFYISDLFRKKITDPERLSRIKDALMQVIS